LEPAPEFTKLAIANIETRNLTQAVVESWKPVVASAVDEWARQRMLTAALTAPQASANQEPTSEGVKVDTTPEELEAFATIAKLLGSDLPIAYEDSASYFKVHIANKRTWVFSRLQLGRRNPVVWVPLPPDEATPLVGGRATSSVSGWTLVTLEAPEHLIELGALFRAAHAFVMESRSGATVGD
jgi:hypothetical protein